MSEKVSTLDVRQRLGDMLNRVALRHDEFIIERKGKPLAALVPVYRLEQMREFARQRALEMSERQKGRNGALSDDEAMRLANEAKRWARRSVKTGKRRRP
ncbi:MAG: type II toxin-antitoxin system prevent-host-death family antitoxin [Candidatus Odyssella sp.]|nr:type II toxin-antitoxin system prevent-host-death family antitoxin [Candidatus Odyssella sp.]